MFRRSLVAAAISLAAAGAHAQVLLAEGFENIAGLAGAGWSFNNLSSPVGTTGWFAGVADPVDFFTAQAGSDGSYIAANFNNGVDGGTIDNRMSTAAFSLANAGSVTFWARAVVEAPYFDVIKFGIDTGSGVTASFATATLTSTWTRYTTNFAAAGASSTGRFMIAYVGDASNSNYIGIDTLTVTAVPEPATLLLLGAGVLGLAGVQRRRAALA